MEVIFVIILMGNENKFLKISRPNTLDMSILGLCHSVATLASPP